MTKSIITDLFDRMPEDSSEAGWIEFFIQVESIATNENCERQPEVHMVMAILYENGLGVLKDIHKAINWYTKAADQEVAEAQYSLGELYDNPCYVIEDYKQKCFKWIRKAAEQGHVKAQYKLSFIYYYGRGVHEDHKQAVKWCKKAAKQGYLPAQRNLAEEYSWGGALEKNFSKAAKWYEKAAKQGCNQAQWSLGELYEGGWGVKQNYPLAYSLFDAAAKQGCSEGVSYRDMLEEKMSAEQVAEAKTLEVQWESKKV